MLVGAGLVAVVLGDLNGDQELDIVTANKEAATVSVLLGTGRTIPSAAVDYEVGGAPVSVAVIDADYDGFVDIVTANIDTDTISVLFGNGRGVFTSRSDFVESSHPCSVAGAFDYSRAEAGLLISHQTDSTVSFRVGTVGRALTGDVRYTIDFPSMSVALADMDNLNGADVITTNASANSVSLLLNNGNGTFGTRADFPTQSYPTALAVADIDEDGRLDVVTANRDANKFTVMFGRCR